VDGRQQLLSLRRNQIVGAKRAQVGIPIARDEALMNRVVRVFRLSIAARPFLHRSVQECSVDRSRHRIQGRARLRRDGLARRWLEGRTETFEFAVGISGIREVF